MTSGTLRRPRVKGLGKGFAITFFALAASRCSAPVETPSPLFRWPEGWPLPSETDCGTAARKGKDAERFADLEAALRSGRFRTAEAKLAELARSAPTRPADLRLAGAEVALLRQEPAEALARLGDPSPGDCAAVVVLRTEAYEASGDVESAWKSVRGVASTPDHPRLTELRARIENRRVALLEAAVRAAVAEGDAETARKIGSQLVVEHPRRPEGFLAFADAALVAEDPDAALPTLRRGLETVSDRVTLLEAIVRIASEAGRWQEALEAAEEIERGAPERREWVDGIRASWSAANAPEPVRLAIESVRLTRAQLAVLLWWLVPELRTLSVVDPPIATDVVDRADKVYLIRALALGIWTVDPITHALRPETPVGRRELGAILSSFTGTLSPPDRTAGESKEWIPDGAEGSPERLDGRTAAAAIRKFRQDVLGRTQ